MLQRVPGTGSQGARFTAPAAAAQVTSAAPAPGRRRRTSGLGTLVATKSSPASLITSFSRSKFPDIICDES